MPTRVVVFSGKRKSGKDFVTELLLKRIGEDKCSILRLSEPLKRAYAEQHSLDLQKLLGASEYKEKYRGDMIRWGEEQRDEDSAYFCRLTSTGPGSEKDIWLISDARRMSDLSFFQTEYNKQLLSVRVEADECIRKARGWEFTAGIDDAESECGLDEYKKWDHIICNNGSAEEIESDIEYLMKMCTSL